VEDHITIDETRVSQGSDRIKALRQIARILLPTTGNKETQITFKYPFGAGTISLD
jgi:hypothetical protein